jgi:hypothetical protein
VLLLRRILIYTHRWLGIAGCVLFIAWFASGIVMMYVRMPELGARERVARLPPLDLSTARVSLASAFPAGVDRVRVNMLEGRPVYRAFRRGAWTTVFADTGERLERVGPDEAIAIAKAFAAGGNATPRYDAYLTGPDQWTLGEPRRSLPLHRIAMGDAADSYVYISERTGEAVMLTDGAARRWSYAGAVLHWLYFTPLRRESALWAQVIIWSSIAGCVLCLSGLVWGVWRFSAAARYRLKRERSHTPYAGLMRWHHYAGLIVGAFSFTWIFSGLLSMNPWDVAPGTSPTRAQRDAMAGGPLRLDRLTIDSLLDAADRFRPARELDAAQFGGEPFWTPAIDPPLRYDEGTLHAAAPRAMPDAAERDAAWLEAYDSYYYDRGAALPLPVLRVRYDDPDRTWLYLEPRRGVIVQREVRGSRVNRWLYHGLHSLDFPFMYYRRPLWDIIVIVLSIGGIVLSATTIAAGVHRLRRHARRLANRATAYERT